MEVFFAFDSKPRLELQDVAEHHCWVELMDEGNDMSTDDERLF